MRNYTMRYFLFFTFIFTSTLSFGQSATIKKIEQINPITKEKYVFPNIFIQGSPNRARKINNKLRSEILDVDAGIPESKIFTQVWRTAEKSPTLHDLSYKVIRNNNSILSIKISAEGCGAYCESWDRYFTFNLKTGNQLHLDSLMTAKGLLQVSKKFDLFKQAKLNAKIKEIQDTLKTSAVQKDKELLAYYTEMSSLYANCLDRKITYDYITNLEFSFTASSLIIYSDRCSAHYNRNVDELWNFEYTIELKDWTNYLSTYARALVHK